MTRTEAEQLYRHCSARLLAARADSGVWRGHLSSSALSTAVAAFALRRLGEEGGRRAAALGESWLVRTIRTDGSWGDTPVSQGNLSTTLLAMAALRHSPQPEAVQTAARADAWVRSVIGTSEPERLAAAVLAHYGEDRTFSVPILTLCAVAGVLGDEPECWRAMPQLPFELAALPRACFGAVGLPVVSYALPALIAMGLARYRCGPQPALGWRGLLEPAALRRLGRIQPENGGFLEAVPLTGFVVLSLTAAGRREHATTRKGTAFLLGAQRADGSWPIDTDLATWVTTLSVGALGSDLPVEAQSAIAPWLLAQQFHHVHPYTGAAAGGWAWTDLPGGVPDADDTAGALLALHHLAPGEPRVLKAAAAGLTWLLDLANRDGGMPTFCRGWGRLPFDRSCPDITAHALRAFRRWEPAVSRNLQRRLRAAVSRALAYLAQAQRPDGTWLPLWFGNEAAAGHANPVYGTARVLSALRDVPGIDDAAPDWVERAVTGLVSLQAETGGWGGDRGVAPSVEETALAVTALAPWPAGRPAASRGVDWLVQHQAQISQPQPIGLYFASLWYHEELYPLIFATEALHAWLSLPELGP